MIRAEQLSQVYRSAKGEVRALDQVSLELSAGEFVVLRGPSGCGKTTLLLALGGMLRPTSGAVRWHGQDLYALPVVRRAGLRARTMGVVFQMFHLIPYLSVLENVLLPAGGREPDALERARALLDEVGLTERAEHRPSELSVGERQRAALARALWHRPLLLLADEPTGNLDPDSAALVFRRLARYHEAGGTVFLVTHGDGAEALATRVLRMQAGRLTA